MGIEANRRWGVCSLNEFRKVSRLTFCPEYSLTSIVPVVPLLETWESKLLPHHIQH